MNKECEARTRIVLARAQIQHDYIQDCENELVGSCFPVSDVEKKKKSTFRKVEHGMIFTDDNEKTIAVGFPTKIKEIVGGKAGAKVSLRSVGGDIEGEKYSEVDYHWEFIGQEPIDREEIEEFVESVAVASGTFVTSYGAALHYIPCPTCGKQNDWDASFCKVCGTSIVRESNKK